MRSRAVSEPTGQSHLSIGGATASPLAFARHPRAADRSETATRSASPTLAQAFTAIASSAALPSPSGRSASSTLGVPPLHPLRAVPFARGRHRFRVSTLAAMAHYTRAVSQRTLAATHNQAPLCRPPQRIGALARPHPLADRVAAGPSSHSSLISRFPPAEPVLRERLGVPNRAAIGPSRPRSAHWPVSDGGTPTVQWARLRLPMSPRFADSGARARASAPMFHVKRWLPTPAGCRWGMRISSARSRAAVSGWPCPPL